MKLKRRRYTTIIGLVLSLIGLVLVGIVVIGISLYGLDKKENKTMRLEQYSSEGEQVTYFSLHLEEVSLQKTQSNAFEIKLNTEETYDVARVLIHYDASKVDLGTVENGDIFSSVSIHAIDDNTVAVAGVRDDPLDTYEGSGILAILNFTPISTDNSVIEVICETENDNSSISYRGNQLLNCSANTGLVLENIADPNDMGDDDGNDQGGDGDSDADNDEGEGDSGTGGTQTNLTPEPPSTSSCSNPKPARPVGLKAVPGGRKQVVLTWNKVEGEVTHYGVTYGRYWVDGKGPEEYAADNIGNGDTTTYTVNGLDLNTLYYFVITANNGCANSGYSDGASSYAGVGSVATSVSDNSWSQQASIKANIKPTPTPKPSLEKGFANVGMGTDSSTASARKITKEPTPTIEPVVYTPPETTKENPLMKTLEKFLPYAGFGVLVLLGGLFILLVKYVRQQDMTTDL